MDVYVFVCTPIGYLFFYPEKRHKVEGMEVIFPLSQLEFRYWASYFIILGRWIKAIKYLLDLQFFFDNEQWDLQPRVFDENGLFIVKKKVSKNA